MTPTYQIQFLGCKANQSDALSYAGILQRAGWRQASGSESPRLFVIQTCTVTMSADAQARQLVRRLKREHPQASILMTGCYAERAQTDLSQMPGVDYVIGNLDPRKLELVSEIAGQPVNEAFPDFALPAATPRSRPYIKIQDGCDARCSYCIIPSVRGKSRSLPAAEVLRRVEMYRDSGFREMILTGISLGSYGKDLIPKCNLSFLLRKLDELRGDFKIRISSVEPEEIDSEFIDVFTSSSRFQPHLHLPLQSASDAVLKRMRRQYLFRRYDTIVRRLFDGLPDLNLGTDLLIGFPDEDRNGYEETRRYFEEAPFAYAHVFPFSPRPDTPAAQYSTSATHQEITQRAAELRAISSAKNLCYRQRFLGRSRSALRLHGAGEALTDNYIRVQLADAARAHRSEPIAVRIDSVGLNETLGSVIN
jgi:threonylcarbamoyladenosine tRNA methylthiotransferase MtaB